MFFGELSARRASSICPRQPQFDPHPQTAIVPRAPSTASQAGLDLLWTVSVFTRQASWPCSVPASCSVASQVCALFCLKRWAGDFGACATPRCRGEGSGVIVYKVTQSTPEVDLLRAQGATQRWQRAGVWIVREGVGRRVTGRGLLDTDSEVKCPCSLLHATSIAAPPRRPGAVKEGVFTDVDWPGRECDLGQRCAA